MTGLEYKNADGCLTWFCKDHYMTDKNQEMLDSSLISQLHKRKMSACKDFCKIMTITMSILALLALAVCIHLKAKQ